MSDLSDVVGLLPRTAAAAARLGYPLSDEQLGLLDRYRALLLAANTRLHLAAEVDEPSFEPRHFVDALAGLRALPRRPGIRVVDVGAGGGLPGLALRIARPDLRLTSIEAREKKAAFIAEAAAELGLEHVAVVNALAEEVGRDPVVRESWDLAVTRSVAKLTTVAELCLPLVRVGGQVIAWSRRDLGPELPQAERAAALLGGRITSFYPVDLPGVPDGRQLVVFAKEAPTPPELPRPARLPRQRPLGAET